MKAWVFQINAEVSPLPGSEMADLGNPGAGAFVNVYSSAETLEESIESVKAALTDNNYELIALEWARKLDFDKWDETEGEPSLAKLSELLESDECLFGNFLMFERRDEH
jgi:hypothetical protein